MLVFHGIGRRTWRQRFLADGADRHLKEIRQHVVALPVVGGAIKDLDELLPEVGWCRHAWSFLPAWQGAGRFSRRRPAGRRV
jgi:hypothetical protein